MSKLRVNEFVNHEDNGSPNFPHSAVVPTPTENNHFANKLYCDTSISEGLPCTNTISKQPPFSPTTGDFWTDISKYWTSASGNNIISLNVWNGSSWVNVKNTQEVPVGQIISAPTITSTTNTTYSTITASPGSVSDAYYLRSRWYLNDVEIPKVTGREYYVTKPGTYKYEEIWINAFEDEVLPSFNVVVSDILVIATPAVLTPTDGEGVGLPRSYTPKTSAITSIDFDSNWTPPATGISDDQYHYYIFSDTNAYDGNTQLAQSLTEAFPTGTQVDVPGGGYVSGYTSSSSTGPNSMIMQIRKDEKGLNQSTYIDNPSLRDSGIPTYFDDVFYMEGYGGPQGRYIMRHSSYDLFYSDDGGATIQPLPHIPKEDYSVAHFAYNPISQVLIMVKRQGVRSAWYSTNGGYSWTKSTNTSVGGTGWFDPVFVAFSYDSNGNPTSGEFRASTGGGNIVTSNMVRSTDGINWSHLHGLSSGWRGYGHYYHAAADKSVILETRYGTRIGYVSGTGIGLSSSAEITEISTTSAWPATTIDGDLDTIRLEFGSGFKVVYDPHLGKMFMFGGWEDYVWWSSNATSWSKKELPSPSIDFMTTVNTGSSFVYVFWETGNRWLWITTDPSEPNSNWVKKTNAFDYISQYKIGAHKMVVGNHSGSARAYSMEYAYPGYSAGYSIGDTISSLTSTTLPGLSASAVSPTSSAPTVSSGAVSSWDYAEWQLATDSAFTQNVQTSTVPLSSSGTQTGPSFSYNNGTTYYIRTRYASETPARVSDWSSTNHFKTA